MAARLVIPAADIWAVTAPAAVIASTGLLCQTAKKLAREYESWNVGAKRQPQKQPENAARPSVAAASLPPGPYPSVPHAATSAASAGSSGGAA